MIALIDSDILVYRIGFTTQDVSPDELYIVKSRLEKTIYEILKALDTRHYQCYLTGQEKDNYRYEIYPEYKAGRGPKPVHYQALRDFLILDHNANVINGMEADDALGIDQSENTIIVSIDKDLDQIPGWHYNFVKGIKYYVEPYEACKKFYIQLLMGDRIDNIPGIKGIGPKTAEKWLRGLTSEEDLYKEVAKRYQEIYGPEEGLKLMLKWGSCLKIKRRLSDPNFWVPPSITEETKDE